MEASGKRRERRERRLRAHGTMEGSRFGLWPKYPALFLSVRVQLENVRAGGSRECHQRFASPLRSRKVDETEALREKVAPVTFAGAACFSRFSVARTV